MPPTNSHQITVEKTPSYFVTKSAPDRVHAMSRDVRLIVVVRDPVTRAISDYAQARAKRPDMRSFASMAFLDNATAEQGGGPVATSWGAVKIGVYAKHLERWLRYFPLERFHFVHGERLISDPAGELALLQDFLQLKRVVTERHFYFDAAKGFPCLKRSEAELAGGSEEQSYTGARVVTVRPPPHCLGKTKGRTHPNVDATVIRRLRDFFRPFNEKFYRMTNINFGWP